MELHARCPGGHRDRADDQPLEGLGAAGQAGELVAELVKDPDKQVQRAVENFRQVVERGGLNPARPPPPTCGSGLGRGRRNVPEHPDEVQQLRSERDVPLLDRNPKTKERYAL